MKYISYGSKVTKRVKVDYSQTFHFYFEEGITDIEKMANQSLNKLNWFLKEYINREKYDKCIL